MQAELSKEAYAKQLYAKRVLQEFGSEIRPGYEYIYRNIARGKK